MKSLDIGKRVILEPWHIPSLTHLITNYTFNDEEFWQIFGLKEAIISGLFLVFIIYKNNTIKVLDVPILLMNRGLRGQKIMVSGIKIEYTIKN